MRLLLTRPQEDSVALEAMLAERGHEAIVEPLLTIRPDLNAPLDLEGVAALLFTSANGARAFALRSHRRDLPVFAVGDASAQAARDLGFAKVESAGGDVAALGALVAHRHRPEDGALLHVAGSVTAGDLAGALREAGYDVRRAVLYAAEPVRALSDSCRQALREGKLDAAVFFSPRTATVFATLIEAAGLAASVRGMTAIGISPAVIEAAGTLPWRRLEAAAEPNEESLAAAIERVAAAPARTPAKAPAAAAGPERPARRRGGALAAVLALAALGVAGGTAWQQFQAQQAPAARAPDRGPEIAALAERLGRAEAAAQRAADEARAAAVVPQRFADVERGAARLAAAVEQLGARIGALERAPRPEGQTDSAAPVDAAATALLAEENRRFAVELALLRREVAELQRAAVERPAAAARRDAFAIAVGQLREAMVAGRGYAAELATARAAAGDAASDAAFAALVPQAARGVPTLARLRADFQPVAAAIVHAAATAASDGSWWQAALARISAAVSIRRVGAVEGDGPEARVARAELLLDAGDLGGAIAALDGLAGAPAAAAATWLAAARARADAEAALASLARRALGG